MLVLQVAVDGLGQPDHLVRVRVQVKVWVWVWVRVSVRVSVRVWVSVRDGVCVRVGVRVRGSPITRVLSPAARKCSATSAALVFESSPPITTSPSSRSWLGLGLGLGLGPEL